MRTLWPKLLLALVLVTLLTYWGHRLTEDLEQPLGEMLPDLGGLARYLLGVGVLLVLLGAVAHANYGLAFRRWMLRPNTAPYYWIWVCILAWLIFEGLQIRTEAAPEFVDENLLVMGVVVTFIIGYGYVADYLRTRRDQLRLEKQTTEAELTALRAQINPHFLFNVLNTIYSEAQRAKNSYVADLIGQLAGLMRYTLQEANRPQTPVMTELAFIEKYVTLQRARLPQTETVRVSLHIDSDDQPAYMAPLLLIPFVENAFQYGISLDQPSYIDIDIGFENRQLIMHVVNSRPTGSAHRHGAGTGIRNTRQRLERAYPARHELRLDDKPTEFAVFLRIDL
ncbi:sensor histidine kinase [Spirosoma montaniterrae]|uniref:Histidine kinase n=1 Tax=Spirosoma montaniterrae TaxID=1178516 RepID=A0A1P9WYJ4_9BACT|nr:histidine kinase [Spirosoma montaniterrae]AQG80423.1 histidine kinase [Spirosoma montaniterrae]